ncbi:MAG: TrkH family potassium uptake protein [Leptolyngbyaceae cyanobacterium MO_188.B28]|nr:TrkH family potassium uptake protein [Leptolyngbyaceae cyanobacterium MO_188.B28]
MSVARTICSGFLIMIAVGTVLLIPPFSTSSGDWNDPIVALFTATSAVCVTGLIVVDTGSYFSSLGQGIILLLIQLGGLGYMTATTFLLLLLGHRLGLRERLAIQQSMDRTELSGGASLVLSIIATTMIFEITGIFLMLPIFVSDFGSGQGLWLAIFHSVSAFNNAGFSLFSDNLMQYARSPGMNLIITGLVIIGGIGYQVIMEAFLWLRDRLQGDKERFVFSLHFKIVTNLTLALLGMGCLALLFTEFSNPFTLATEGFGVKVIMAWFQSAIARTAGFNTIDIGSLTNTSLLIIASLMFIGASPGSTGGGIKTTTAGILMFCTRSVLQGREEVLCYQRQIPVDRVLRAITVVIVSGMMVIAVTTLISLTDPNLNFIDILFESVSAFATVGLSTGVTADLSTLAKLLLIVTMYVGRVGILLLAAAIFGDAKLSTIRHPKEDL